MFEQHAIVASTAAIDRAGERIGAAMAWARPAGGPWVGILDVLPGAVMLAPTGTVRLSIVIAGFTCVVCAGALAALLAR